MNRGRRPNQRQNQNQSRQNRNQPGAEDSDSSLESVTQGAEFAQAEIDECSKNVVLYILNFSVSKIPIKRSDIVKTCANGKPKLFTAVYQQICADLKHIYGIIVHEVQHIPKPQRFICISSFAATNENEYLPGEKEKLVLLTLLLSFIFMRGGVAKESAIFQFLTGLNIPLYEPHYYFGKDIKKLVTETFTRQLYLIKKKVDTTGIVEEFTYKWGERSKLEFDKAQIFKFACKILGKPIQSFQKQYLEVYENVGQDDGNVDDGAQEGGNTREGDVDYADFI